LKTYLRILHYARPLGQYVLPFFVFSVLASLFGVLNFTLIQPLLDVLFDKVGHQTDVARFNQKPVSPFDLAQWFNYGVGRALAAYGKLGTLRLVCGTIITSVLLSNVFKYLSVRILETFKARTVANLRQAVFDRAVTLHLGFFTNERKGDLMARLTTDVQEIENSVSRMFTAFFREIFTLVFYVVLLFTMSLKLTLFALVIIPLSGVIIGLLAKKLRENAADVQERLANLISLLDETFGGIRVVKAFNAEGFVRRRFSEENQGYRRSLLRMYFRQELASPFSEFSGVLVVCGLLLYGGSLVLGGGPFELSASTFVTYIIVFSQVLRPAKEISNAVSSVQRGAASAERILRLIDTQSEVTELPNARTVTRFSEKIEVENVRFEYAPGRPVLSNINLTIPKGRTVALVGSSGGGKSTLADLIPRFYDPTEGSILLDGVDIRTLTKTSLRSLMGIVTQESILFNDSIFNNIAFGSNASLDEVIAAAQIANAHDFIIASPDGYQTVIGDRGAKLSGGQRQRLSIARAVLKNPPILILDEATSALDTESEKLVQEAITNLMKNRTVLVIAHRLSTIQYADEIVVLHGGQIVERGTHDELLNLEKGHYRRLRQMQVAA
jgi:subfamily B ATP-binding cassette protein MsbA